jgi:hypothetical protein
MPMIECVGVAGSGKSFATDQIVEMLAHRGIVAHAAMAPYGPNVSKATRIRRKCVAMLHEATRSPSATYSLIVAVRASRQATLRDSLSLISKWLVLRSLSVPATDDPVLIFDQGALMAVWSAGLSGQDQPLRALLLTDSWSSVMPDQVLSVKTSFAIVAKHLQSRTIKQSRLEAVDTNERPAVIEAAEYSIGDIVGWWRQQHTLAHNDALDSEGGIVADVWNDGDVAFRELLGTYVESLCDQLNSAPGGQSTRAMTWTSAQT